MCGYVGAFGSEMSSEDLAAAARVIGHRGPDGTSVLQRGPLSIVASRLAIVPPMTDPAVLQCPEGILVMNGEVYIPPERREAHETDTRAVLRRLVTDGPGTTLPSLPGMFSLAWFDGNTLTLARDRFGIKPLYFARYRGGVVFASEMKAILALPSFSRAPDLDVLSAVRVVGHNVFEGRTPFAHVRAVEPGSALVLSVDGSQQSYLFADRPLFSAREQDTRSNEIAERVELLLSNAVRRTMLHDPCDKAMFFSGGLDSTLLLDMAREHGAVTAFVLTDREDAEDLHEARKAASALDVPLTEVKIGSAELAAEVLHYAWHFERPICDGVFDLFGGVAFHALARVVSRSTKVALCGEGADELFLGYHRVHMKPELARSLLAERIKEHATPPVRQWLEEKGLVSDNNGPLSDSLRRLAMRQGLSEYHLPSVDCSGMAFGLEVRPPFLDEDLVSFVSGLPEDALLDRDGNWTKLPLRSIAKRRLGRMGLDRVWIRRKRAMPTAVEKAAEGLCELLGVDQPTRPGCLTLGALMEALFWYLHVDPGCTEPPGFTLAEFAEDLGARGMKSW